MLDAARPILLDRMQALTGEETLGDALVGILQRLPLAKWTFTTLGSRGAVMLQRVAADVATGVQLWL